MRACPLILAGVCNDYYRRLIRCNYQFILSILSLNSCTGSGGNNHAVDHYDTTKYPLAVKLGTITPGGADVYSYDEDDMVLDPKLPEHLSHFGINMMIMNKVRNI